jgi:hypothetical protein
MTQIQNFKSIKDVNNFIYNNRQEITSYLNKRFRGFDLFPFTPSQYEQNVILETPDSWVYDNRNKTIIFNYVVSGWIHAFIKRIFYSYSKTSRNRIVTFNNMNFSLDEEDKIICFFYDDNLNKNKIVSDYIDTYLLELKMSGNLLANSKINGSVKQILKMITHTSEERCTH